MQYKLLPTYTVTHFLKTGYYFPFSWTDALAFQGRHSEAGPESAKTWQRLQLLFKMERRAH